MLAVWISLQNATVHYFLMPFVLACGAVQDTFPGNQRTALYYRDNIQLSPPLPLLSGLYIYQQILQVCQLQDLQIRMSKQNEELEL
jgi:hypothetical protein